MRVFSESEEETEDMGKIDKQVNLFYEPFYLFYLFYLFIPFIFFLYLPQNERRTCLTANVLS